MDFQWHITNLCNLRCKHCYQDDFSSDSDLGWSKLKRVADNILDALKKIGDLSGGNKTRINITGGEPFLKKELFLLLEYLDNRDEVKELSLITNGTILNEPTIDKLKKFSKLKNIKVSLDGINQLQNDYIRGKGSFNKVLKNIMLLKKIKKWKVILMFTLLKRNFRSISDAVDFCRRVGFDSVMFERFIPEGNGVGIKDEVLDKNDWEKTVNAILELCKIPMTENEVLRYKAFWIKFQKNQLHLSGAPCSIGDAFCIMPDGNVYPCRRFNLSIGNLLKEPLEGIIRESSVLNKVKDKRNLKGKCQICKIDECLGCRAVGWALQKNYLAEDIHCWV